MLRRATNADLPAIVALVTEGLAEFGYAPDFATSEADLVDLEASYDGVGGLFFVWEESRLLGTGGIFPLGEGAWKLRKMYVRREAQGRGLGRAMVERLVQEARVRGAQRVVLETTAGMTAAQRLYESCGFRVEPGVPTSPRCDRVYGLDLPPLRAKLV